MMHMSEDALQELVAAFLDLWGVCWFHCPNEGKRSRWAADKVIKAGLKKGVPDCMICEDWESTAMAPGIGGVDETVTTGHGLAIELKVNTRAGKKQYPSPFQREWIANLKARGWKVAVCRSLTEVQEACRCLRPLHGREAPF